MTFWSGVFIFYACWKWAHGDNQAAWFLLAAGGVVAVLAVAEAITKRQRQKVSR